MRKREASLLDQQADIPQSPLVQQEAPYEGGEAEAKRPNGVGQIKNTVLLATEFGLIWAAGIFGKLFRENYPSFPAILLTS